MGPRLLWSCLVVACAACRNDSVGHRSDSDDAVPEADGADQPEAGTKMVGYDIRWLRPRNEESLARMFDRMQKVAVDDGKQVAVLFSADWCEQCRTLDLELGNMHPLASIGHVRILEIKEEDWEGAMRKNEFDDLRTRWQAAVNTYPLFVLLDRNGNRVEEMREAIDRLEAMGIEPTVSAWFESIRDPRT